MPRKLTVQRHISPQNVPDLTRRPNPAPEHKRHHALNTQIATQKNVSDQTRPGEQKRRATPGRSLLVNTGRDDWIRTSDPLLPKQETSVRLRLSTVCLPRLDATSRNSLKGLCGWSSKTHFGRIVLMQSPQSYGLPKINDPSPFQW